MNRGHKLGGIHTIRTLNLYSHDGQPLEPYSYPSGKTQVDLIKDIIEAFKSNDIVFFHGVVGSGKSVIGLRSILEFGRGTVSVPTKVLSYQYAASYGEDKYFVKDDYSKAEIGILKGRRNFRCMHMADKGRKASCTGSTLPCRVSLKEGVRRIDALRGCRHWGFIFRSDLAESVEDTKKVSYAGVKGEWTWCMKGNCPYWRQFKAYVSSDVVVMNSAKWAAEVIIGRLPKTSITVIDEADTWLDSLAVKVIVTERLIDRLKKTVEQTANRYEQEPYAATLVQDLRDKVGELQELWSETLAKKSPLKLAEFLVHLFEEIDETSGEQYYKLKLVLEYKNHVEWEVEKAVEKEKNKITYCIPYPKFILQRFLERVGGKWLLMSATVQSPSVLKDVFGIEPTIVEGKTEFPGVIVQHQIGTEKCINKTRWNDDRFKEECWNTQRDIVSRAARPGFVPIHSNKYLAPHILKKIEQIQQFIRAGGEVGQDTGVYNIDGIQFSTKLDRGADLKGMRSIIPLKFPYPDLGDPLLVGLLRRLGPSAFWTYYHDMAKRDFIQQIGRTLRSDSDVVEFWSPDKTCHTKLRLWKGKISEGKA